MSLRIRQASTITVTTFLFLFSLVLSAFAIPASYFYDDGNRLVRIEYDSGATIEFAYNESGNRTQKTVTSADGNAPVTTASPLGGTYLSAQSVSLICDDGAGTGCDKVYYTTDGTAPTTGSTIYTAPLTIDVTTALKFFATDLAGFSETVNTQTYVITNGKLLQATVRMDAQNPLPGVKVYLFNGSGSYLGQVQTTNTTGVAGFDVSPGTFKVRADYLGYQFWSNAVAVADATNIDLTLPHHTVTITVNGTYQGTSTPISGLKVYLFTPAGGYLGKTQMTNANGQVSFTLPDKDYKVRVDYLGAQYFSTVFNAQDTAVNISMSDAVITVTQGGRTLSGVPVYVFTPAGAYLGKTSTTDAAGKATIRLPVGTYKIRGDYRSNQYWSAETALTADQEVPVSINTGGETFTLTVSKGASDPLAGVSCYVFSETGAYLGLTDRTNSSGQVQFDLPNGNYKIRVDYLGAQFWTNVFTITGASSLTFLIPQVPVNILVSTAAGPAAGARVYLFSAAGAYLGISGDTNANGLISFNLPEGVSFKFRADILGNSYWSGVISVSSGMTEPVPIISGGGRFQILVRRDASTPMEGVSTYLFNASDTYLGFNGKTDSGGLVEYDVPQGNYKVRVDYLGYSYWSEVKTVNGPTSTVLTIEHRSANITVSKVFNSDSTPAAGLNVYLFTPGGTYLGQSHTTAADGRVVFELPAQNYKVRADYLGGQYWSPIFNGVDSVVNVPMAEADVTVGRSGSAIGGVSVYVFSAAGAYLGMSGSTDQTGKATFRLPVGSYKIRADYQGKQFWSLEAALAADQVVPVTVEVGGGAFVFTLLAGANDPLAGVACYVFTEAGAYIGLSGTSDASGQTSFDLSNGRYKIRVDYLGSNFWTDVIDVSESLAFTKLIPHQSVTVSVQGVLGGDIQPRSSVPVYLFSPVGAYLAVNATTGAYGQVQFKLPEIPFKVRADYLGQHYWSNEFTWEDTSVTIPEGTAYVHVCINDQNIQSAAVYVFSSAGAYLGMNDTTDADGIVEFRLPAGSYKFRADCQGNQYWAEAEIVADVVNGIEINGL
ncbi:MAG: chitobiase/beta-hexosaminidase C-terminal domain-containing protein [Deltaproteobacteria bacterium]|nr:chitobiase/beta-hexosaminidase C-terminal domain-containing protein [Deltaproteobacteria bacterium]